MQLTAFTVNWNKLERLRFDGGIDAALAHQSEELELGEPPWPSDSTIQLLQFAECYDDIKPELTSTTRSIIDKIMQTLITPSFILPWELMSFTRGEHIVGAISPTTVRDYLNTFSQLDFHELDAAFDSRMPHEISESCEITSYPSEVVFTGYLQQWRELFVYATAKNAGILFHLG